MVRAWLINSRGIAKKVKNATRYSNHQIRDLGTEAKRECPNCQYIIDNSDSHLFSRFGLSTIELSLLPIELSLLSMFKMLPKKDVDYLLLLPQVSLEWPGLPAGVKFDPTDIELLDHLKAKTGAGSVKAHIFIDEFIPTLDGDQGICYTHPENLPGVRKDGSSVHFFHRTSNAYATGHRKLRSIHSKFEERVRWHKTGKTKPVRSSGVWKGWKKIMVLYRSSGKGNKPDKASWVMHQYHLGIDEDEKDGELVVSKIFYQQTKKKYRSGTDSAPESSAFTVRIGPRTPKKMTPEPPRLKLDSLYEDDEHATLLGVQEEDAGSTWWADESQAVEEPDPRKIDEPLQCREILYPFPPIRESSPEFHHPGMILDCKDQLKRYADAASNFSSIDGIEVDTPPDFQLSDLQFCSQDSIMSWLDLP